jgi:hypothetical protein
MTATTTTTDADTDTDQRPTCSACGSHNVETTAWIDYTADGVAHVVSGEGPHGDELGNWCHDCDDHVDLHYPTTTPADDARRQAVNAARQHAEEMLELLRAIVRPMNRPSTPDDCAACGSAMFRARELVALLT